ncbi:MAG: asparagine synthase (glutamine-hydrolyzing) [Terriglobales bacterium]
MFAFAIWDAIRHRLFLARDHMGVKPLYYGIFGQYFLFASEVRTLLGTGLVPRRLDQAGLLNYLSFGSLYDPVTMIDGVSALRPGHYLTWEKGSLREIRYWDLATAATRIHHASLQSPASAQKSALEDDLHATLDESIRRQMVSDVPVGAFLSGGIDSSSLVGILARNGSKLDTFSIVFREADYSEAEYSRIVALKFGTRHHEIMVSQQNALDAVPGALDAMDLPTIDGFNTYVVSMQARAAGVKVVLSGLGADELFAGYSTFRSVQLMERFARFWRYLPGAARTLATKAFRQVAQPSDQNRKLTSLADGDARVLHPYFLSRMLFTPAQVDSLCLQNASFSSERANAALQEGLAQSSELDPINRISYLETHFYMLNTLLRDSDVMSMAHGLEIRVPFIDHLLAEKVLALPGTWKMSADKPKPLLVDSLRGELPEEIVHRRKRGFTLPFEHWLRDDLRPRVESTLLKSSDGPLASFLTRATIRAVWEEFLNGQTSWSRPWSLYVLEDISKNNPQRRPSFLIIERG